MAPTEVPAREEAGAWLDQWHLEDSVRTTISQARLALPSHSQHSDKDTCLLTCSGTDSDGTNSSRRQRLSNNPQMHYHHTSHTPLRLVLFNDQADSQQRSTYWLLRPPAGFPGLWEGVIMQRRCLPVTSCESPLSSKRVDASPHPPVHTLWGPLRNPPSPSGKVLHTGLPRQADLSPQTSSSRAPAGH